MTIAGGGSGRYEHEVRNLERHFNMRMRECVDDHERARIVDHFNHTRNEMARYFGVDDHRREPFSIVGRNPHTDIVDDIHVTDTFIDDNLTTDGLRRAAKLIDGLSEAHAMDLVKRVVREAFYREPNRYDPREQTPVRPEDVSFENAYAVRRQSAPPKKRFKSPDRLWDDI